MVISPLPVQLDYYKDYGTSITHPWITDNYDISVGDWVCAECGTPSPVSEELSSFFEGVDIGPLHEFHVEAHENPAQPKLTELMKGLLQEQGGLPKYPQELIDELKAIKPDDK